MKKLFLILFSIFTLSVFSSNIDTCDFKLTKQEFKQEFLDLKLQSRQQYNSKDIKVATLVGGVTLGTVMIVSYSSASNVNKDYQKPYLVSFLIVDAALVIYVLATH
jgi:hypothetical protein